MPWQETSAMDLRQEFVMFALQDGANLRELCRRFGISAKTGYKWLQRAKEDPDEPLIDRSRRPHTSPTRTPAAIEAKVVEARRQFPTWGGRKLHQYLTQQGMESVPHPSTITAILHRHGRIDPEQVATPEAPNRFEHPEPNALWQLDFMGHVPMVTGRLHPLVLIDDHSRFALGVWACDNEQRQTVQQALTTTFQYYGLPAALLTDNGSPWGSSGAGGITGLEAWLTQLGIQLLHGQPYHPQTQGKVERLHRTLATDVTNTQRFVDLAAAQRAFDRWRGIYNRLRPHDALAGAPPASRYSPSRIPFPKALPPIEYDADDAVRTVQSHGMISFRGQMFPVGTGLQGLPVAVRPTSEDDIFTIHFCHRLLRSIDLNAREQV